MNEVQQCIQEKMKFNEAFLAQNLPQTDSFSSAEISFHSENEEDVFQLTPETAAKYGIPYRQLVVPDVETAKKLTGTPDIFFDENIVSAEGCADYIDWSQQENRTAKNLCTLTAAYIYGDSRKVKQHEKLINKASFPLTIDYYGSSSTDYRIANGKTLTVDAKGGTVAFEARTITFCGKATLSFLNGNAHNKIKKIVGETMSGVTPQASILASGGHGGHGGNGTHGASGANGVDGAKDGDPAKNGGHGSDGTRGTDGGVGCNAGSVTHMLEEITTDTVIYSFGGNGGNGGDGGNGGGGGRGGNGTDSKNHGRGGDGGNGGDGREGGSGGNGGNGANVTVLYGTGSQRIIEIKSCGGNGGTPGTRGRGGSGGSGGNRGKNGARGDRGNNGRDGSHSTGGNGGKGGEVIIQPLS